MKQPAQLAAWRAGVVVVVGESVGAAIAALEPSFVAASVALLVDYYAVDELEEVSASTSVVPLGFHSWPWDAVELDVVRQVDRLAVGLPSSPVVSGSSTVFAVGAAADLLPASQIEDSPLSYVLASRSSISKLTKRKEMTKYLVHLRWNHME